MSNYLMKKYKGKYRLKANLDYNTNDFPRDDKGNIETDDVYIKCYGGSQIYHYGHSILVGYIPSIGRGHNILIDIANKLLGYDFVERYGRNYEILYAELEKEGTIRNIIENDSEIEFRFNSNDIEFISDFLKPQTSGSQISPFSTKNLPKEKYTIPNNNLREYKYITNEIGKDNFLIISKITRRFITDILQKKKEYRSINIKADMKKRMLKGKEYIHATGYWDEYLDYLKQEIINGH